MNSIIEHYNAYDEEGRLDRDNAHRMEFLTTIHFLNKLLQSGSSILDVGAGTGRYSLHFASRGFQVTAVELAPKNAEMIKVKLQNQKISNVTVYNANALDLSIFPDSSFDNVLCMGPLYHLKEEAEKMQCLRECTRLLKPGGILAVAYINKYAAYLLEALRDKESPNMKLLDNVIKTGFNCYNKKDCFYFTSPDEVENLVHRFSVEKVTNIGVDGICHMLSGILNQMKDEDFDCWLNYHLATCQTPSFLGYSLHGLYIGKKL